MHDVERAPSSPAPVRGVQPRARPRRRSRRSAAAASRRLASTRAGGARATRPRRTPSRGRVAVGGDDVERRHHVRADAHREPRLIEERRRKFRVLRELRVEPRSRPSRCGRSRGAGRSGRRPCRPTRSPPGARSDPGGAFQLDRSHGRQAYQPFTGRNSTGSRCRSDETTRDVPLRSSRTSSNRLRVRVVGVVAAARRQRS